MKLVYGLIVIISMWQLTSGQLRFKSGNVYDGNTKIGLLEDLQFTGKNSRGMFVFKGELNGKNVILEINENADRYSLIDGTSNGMPPQSSSSKKNGSRRDPIFSENPSRMSPPPERRPSFKGSPPGSNDFAGGQRIFGPVNPPFGRQNGGGSMPFPQEKSWTDSNGVHHWIKISIIPQGIQRTFEFSSNNGMGPDSEIVNKMEDHFNNGRQFNQNVFRRFQE